MFNVGGSEMIALAILALLVFGPEGMPGVIKKVVRTVRALRTAASDFQTEIRNALEEESNRLDEEKRSAKLSESKVENAVLAQAGESVPADSEEVAVVAGENAQAAEPQTEMVSGEERSAQAQSPEEAVAQEAPDEPIAEAAEAIDSGEPAAKVALESEPPAQEVAEDVSISDEATADELPEEPEPEDDDGPGLPMRKPVRSVEA